MSESDIIIPDGIEPIIGWRAWHVDGPPRRPFLTSVITNRNFWPPREPLEARCGSGLHKPPEETCTCGVYAKATRGSLLASNYYLATPGAPGLMTFGSVLLWGKVIVGQEGYRAQFAYPKRLYIPRTRWRSASALREAYGVPVSLVPLYEWPRGGEYR